MKILLTGATGFVGSHILDALRARGLPVAILLRSTSSTRFIEAHRPQVERRIGSISEPATLREALAGITHVIHCAGATKALHAADFYQVNQVGTRNLVEAINAQPGVERCLLISSLAAAGPGTPDKPARESDTPCPVSEYGKSKLAGEIEVRNHCRVEYVILRPAGVYGPRDLEFLRLFKAVKAHLLPRPPRQALSLVFAPDLAEAAVTCLQHPAAAGKCYFVASREVTSAVLLALEIATQLGVRTISLPLPRALMWLLCLGQELASRATRRANVLSMQKFAELRAPGWVCDPGLLRREIGFECPTGLREGVTHTLNWYRQNEWL